MLKQSITPEDVVVLLNEAILSDSKAVGMLIAARVPCNDRLADHSTIQVGLIDGKYRVGLLGMLNGMFGIDEDGYGPITAVFNGAGELVEFKCR